MCTVCRVERSECCEVVKGFTYGAGSIVNKMPGGQLSFKNQKAVAEHFTVYLFQKDYLNQKYEIEKSRMRKILLQEYMAEYHVRTDPFVMICALAAVNLIKGKKRSSEIVSFRPEKVHKLNKAGSPKLDSSLTKPIVRVTANQQSVFCKRIERPEALTSVGCQVCGVTFPDNEAYTNHEKEDDHVMKECYRKRNCRFANAKSEVSILVKGEEHGILSLRPGAHGVTSLQIQNSAAYDVEISKIAPIIDVHEVIFSPTEVPLVIKAGVKVAFELKYGFDFPGAYHYVIGFRAQLNTDIVYLVKEVVFQVQSELMDSLKPTQPFKRKLKSVVKHKEAPVICGEPLPIIPSQLRNKRRLAGFDLEPSLNRILNNGLKPFKEMKAGDKKKLKEVRALLKLDSEVIDAETLLNEKNYNQIFHLLLYIEEHKMNMDIRMYDCENVALKPVPGQGKLLSLQNDGFAEKRPSILRGDKVFVQIEDDDSVRYEGIVHKVRRDEAWLGFHRKLMSKFMENMKFHVEYSFNRHPLRFQHRAVEFAQQHHMASVLFPTIETLKSVPIVNINHWYNEKIRNNEEQKLAVCNIVSGSSYPAPYLIFGPPGTGKTLTLVEAITQLYYLKDKVCHILVCAPSNAAADEITKRLVKSGTGCITDSDLFRMYAVSYNSDAIPSEFSKCCNFNKEHEEYYYPELSTIMKYRIVVTTLITAGRLVSASPPEGHFTHVFIDEAGHSVESELLIPIAGLLSTHKRKGHLFGEIVLAGDPKQLGPVLRSTMASELGLAYSLLERLMTKCDVYKRDESTNKYNPAVLVKLVKNFRSHRAIIEVPNKLFYDGELQAVGNPLAELACQWERLPKKGFPVIFHGIVGNNEREANSPSYFNRSEIDVVLSYVDRLLADKFCGRKLTGKDIGVVTPYRKQVQKFKQVFQKRNGLKGITVGSIEEFQGQERLVIIISTVRSKQELVEHDLKFNLGFLNNPKRFNVAVTRAKSLLIAVGNPHILQFDANWRRFIQYCKENGAYKGCKFTVTEEPPTVEKTFDLSSLRTALNDDKHSSSVIWSVSCLGETS